MDIKLSRAMCVTQIIQLLLLLLFVLNVQLNEIVLKS